MVQFQFVFVQLERVRGGGGRGEREDGGKIDAVPVKYPIFFGRGFGARIKNLPSKTSKSSKIVFLPSTRKKLMIFFTLSCVE